MLFRGGSLPPPWKPDAARRRLARFHYGKPAGGTGSAGTGLMSAAIPVRQAWRLR